jgi:hypothetical protein
MASELILILPDYFPRGDAADPDSALPRLPALETLLATARRDPLPQGWRSRFARRFGGRELAALAPAAAVALAGLDSPAQPPTQYWLATPVHLFAGLDSVHLHPAGLLQLSVAAQAALVADFSAVFGDAPWRLHAIGARELLLSGAPLAASAEDPAQFVGRDLGAGLPRGAAAATLRRLGAEIEMWLHEHRINLERQASGELPVNALWLWGALPSAARDCADRALAMPLAASTLYGRDAHAEALWRMRGGRIEAMPEHFRTMLRSGASTHVVLYPTLGADGLSAALQRLEQRWLAPAIQALRARELSAIELFAGSHAYRLSWVNLARFWRTRSPWWEPLA